MTFRDAKGNDIKTIEGNEGDDLLSLAHEHDVDLEGQSSPTPFSITISGALQISEAHMRDFGCSGADIV